jgi:uncharacterized protein YlaN (UPF0358 family)
MIMDVPKRLYDDAEKWLKNARVKLDNFTANSQNPNYIALEMLESKGSPTTKGESDIIASGE